MTKPTGIGRGGARPNAGRKRIDPDQVLKPRAIALSDEQTAYLSAIGGGNYSRGVRMLIDNARKKAQRRGDPAASPSIVTLKLGDS